MKQLLKQLGLEEKEINIYLDCLEYDSNTPADIVKHTGIKRSTVYFYLEKLIEKGLITYTVLGKKRLISATAPKDALPEYANKKKEEASNIEQVALKLIDKFKEYAKQKVTSNDITYYHGNQGARLIMQDIIKQKSDIYWFGSSEKLFSLIGEDEFYKNMTLKRMKTHTTSYAITDKAILKKQKFSEKIGNFRQFSFIEIPKNLEAILIIYSNKIILATKNGKDLQIVAITNEAFSTMVLFLFKQLWGKLN